VWSLAPDVIVYDLAGLLDAPEIDLERLLAGCTPVVALEPHGRPDIVARALRLRVAHVVGADATRAELLTALERAVAAVDVAPGDRDATAELMTVTGLTSRELDVLVKVAAGLSNRQIGAELSLSVNSIKTYIRTAYRKVHVTNRVGAVLWAVHHGLAPLATGER
jgi:DNA-binding NarL/FixJ family response regulator